MADKSVCKIPDCDKPAHARGFCAMHSSRIKRHGSPMAGVPAWDRVRPQCTVEGCSNKNFGHGLCSAHYKRMRKYGDPLGGGPAQTPDGEAMAFLEQARTFQSMECLPWPFVVHHSGYAVIWHEGQNVNAHRLLCEMVNGPPPTPVHQAAHNCGNSICVNPEHLRWATPIENHADKLIHGTLPRGEKVGTAKLRDADIPDIRRRYFLGESPVTIAEDYSVHPHTIYNAAVGKTWGWIKTHHGRRPPRLRGDKGTFLTRGVADRI